MPHEFERAAKPGESDEKMASLEFAQLAPLLGTFIRRYQVGWSKPDTMTATMSGDCVHVVEWHPDRDSPFAANEAGHEYANEALSVREWERRIAEADYVRLERDSAEEV